MLDAKNFRSHRGHLEYLSNGQPSHNREESRPVLLSSSGFMSPWRRKSEPLARSAGGRAHFLELHHLCSRTSLSGAHLHHLHHLLLTHRPSDFCCYLNSSDLCLRPPQLHISSRGRLIELDSVLFLPSSLINEVGGAEKVQAVRWLIYGCRRSRRSSSLCFLHISLWKSEEAGKREKQVSPAEKTEQQNHFSVRKAGSADHGREINIISFARR